jgi:hypothetical protein
VATRHYTDPFSAFGQSFLDVSAQAVSGTGELFYAPVSADLLTLAKL